MLDKKDTLIHVGVKGMKWGVRKDRKSSVSSDASEASVLRKKPVSSLSNSQLKTLNTRLKLEEQHAKLNPKTIARGEMRTKTILASIGTATAVYNLAKSPAGQVGIAAGKKAAKPIIIAYRARKAFG